ncbi:MAG: hypothetical protein HC933_02195 [Pleurocapsa sp. SU_196_0]|nr:hypothetical protein [Pleurocapsa sp. SU_196_0]
MLKLLKRAFGITTLEAELKLLRAEQRQADTLREMAGANRTAHARIGGLEAEILPLPPTVWRTAMDELPALLLMYAVKESKSDVSADDLERFVLNVKKWLRASARIQGAAITEAQLERLSVPEAAVAAKVVSEVNGFDQSLAAFFRERGVRQAARPDRPTVRGTPN